MLEQFEREGFESGRLRVALHALAAVAFHHPFNRHKQIGPDGLRAEITAPRAARDGVHEKQSEGRYNQQAGEVIDFLRPNFDEEEIGPPMRQIDQDGLRGGVRPAVPADKRQEIINAKGYKQDQPFDTAIKPFD